MDALKDYGSSDEVDKDDKDEPDIIETKAKRFENDSDVSGTFGLVSSEPQLGTEEKNEGSKNEAQQVTKRKIKVNNEALDVEIPNSSFWSDTKDLDLQLLQNTHRKSLKKPRHFSQHGSENAKYQLQNFGKRRTGPTQGMEASTGEFGERAADAKTKRKIYFVHPKVTPHLQRHGVHCKVPTTKEWTNAAHAGATNRIKWNIPTYSHLLVSCSMDTTVKIWNVWSKLDPCVQVLRSHDRAVKDVGWNHDGKQILSSSYDKTAVVSDVETGI